LCLPDVISQVADLLNDVQHQRTQHNDTYDFHDYSPCALHARIGR